MSKFVVLQCSLSVDYEQNSKWSVKSITISKQLQYYYYIY